MQESVSLCHALFLSFTEKLGIKPLNFVLIHLSRVLSHSPGREMSANPRWFRDLGSYVYDVETRKTVTGCH
jgi:hypothetical protein